MNDAADIRADIRADVLEVRRLIQGATKDLRDALQTTVPLSPYVVSKIRSAIQTLEWVAGK